jgi:hypothetical protein
LACGRFGVGRFLDHETETPKATAEAPVETAKASQSNSDLPTLFRGLLEVLRVLLSWPAVLVVVLIYYRTG